MIAVGTDEVSDAWITAAWLSPLSLTIIALAAIGVSAIALDASEIVSALVPVLMPPLRMRVPDANWVAVLVMLALQGSFLLRPRDPTRKCPARWRRCCGNQPRPTTRLPAHPLRSSLQTKE